MSSDTSIQSAILTHGLSVRSNVPEDPMFQLTFPQPPMLSQNDQKTMEEAVQTDVSKAGLQHLAERIRQKMNPHPANQKTENVPFMEGEEVPGMQHKYRETVLFFPSEVSSPFLSTKAGDASSDTLLNPVRANIVTPFARIVSAGRNLPL